MGRILILGRTGAYQPRSQWESWADGRELTLAEKCVNIEVTLDCGIDGLPCCTGAIIPGQGSIPMHT
jgi:hypothetical protein